MNTVPPHGKMDMEVGLALSIGFTEGSVANKVVPITLGRIYWHIANEVMPKLETFL
jgi:hypothetical protein